MDKIRRRLEVPRRRSIRISVKERRGRGLQCDPLYPEEKKLCETGVKRRLSRGIWGISRPLRSGDLGVQT